MDTDELRARLRERAEAIDTDRPERLAEVHHRIEESVSAGHGLVRRLGSSPPPWGATSWSSPLDLAPAQALAAAVAVAAVLLGIGFLAGRLLDHDDRPAPGIGPDGHAVTRLPQETGPIPAGRYSLPVGDLPMRALVTVGDGWLANGAEVSNEFVGVSFNVIRAVYRDACPKATQPSRPTRGASVAELVAALDRQRGTDLTEPVEVKVAGFLGVRADLAQSRGVDPPTCSEWFTWQGADGIGRTTEGSDRLWVVDVDGATVVIDAAFPDENSRHPADADAVVATVEFQIP